MRPSSKNASKLREYLKNDRTAKPPAKASTGRPRKHPAGSQRLNPGEQKYTTILKTEHIDKAKEVSIKKNIAIKDVFAQALESYFDQQK